MCTGFEFIAYAALASIATAATTAVSANISANIAGPQKSAAEEASRTQERLFEASAKRFETAALPGGALVIPEPEAIKDTAKEAALKRRQLAARTILTSPVGLINEPAVYRKTLLGQ